MTTPRPPLDPDCADEAPDAETLMPYDMEHLVTYMRLLDSEADRADWAEAARIVLHIDPSREPVRARRAWESHLARATCDGQTGFGIFEHGTVGRHEPTGMTDISAVAP